MKFRSISVEGPIGVGKTSFVERLARRFDAHKVLEDLNNPFLQRFYEDSQGAALIGTIRSGDRGPWENRCSR